MVVIRDQCRYVYTIQGVEIAAECTFVKFLKKACEQESQLVY